MTKQKGVFCLEGVWWGDLKREPSIEPLLDLLDQLATPRRRHIYRDVGTVEEFEYYLRIWHQRRYRFHPILYLAFHGVPGGLLVGDQRRKQGVVSLDRIEQLLTGKLAGKIIHFGACETLDIRTARLNRFLRATKALAVCGYKKEIGWTTSAALDLLLFQTMQLHPFTRPGAAEVRDRTLSQVGKLVQELGFHMQVSPSAPHSTL